MYSKSSFYVCYKKIDMGPYFGKMFNITSNGHFPKNFLEL